MLQVEELYELVEPLKRAIVDNIYMILTKLNREGTLDTVVSLMGIEAEIYPEQIYSVPKAGKILVIGQSEVQTKVLVAIAEGFGISRDRLEFCTDYQESKRYNFSKLKYSTDYSAVMVGPIPHSTNGKGDYSSIIAAMEKEEGYPPVIRLGNNSLKISKSDFKAKLKSMIDQNIITGVSAVCA